MHKPMEQCLKARIWLSATTEDEVYWFPRVTCRQSTVIQELLLSHKSKQKHNWPHSEPSTLFFYNLWCLMLCIKAVHIVSRIKGPTLSLSQIRFSWPCNEEKQIKMACDALYSYIPPALSKCHKTVQLYQNTSGEKFITDIVQYSVNQVCRGVCSLSYFWRVTLVSKEKFSPQNKPPNNKHVWLGFFLHIPNDFKQEM